MSTKKKGVHPVCTSCPEIEVHFGGLDLNSIRRAYLRERESWPESARHELERTERAVRRERARAQQAWFELWLLKEGEAAELRRSTSTLHFRELSVTLTSLEIAFLVIVADNPHAKIETWCQLAGPDNKKCSRSILTGRVGRPGLHAKLASVGVRVKSHHGLLRDDVGIEDNKPVFLLDKDAS